MGELIVNDEVYKALPPPVTGAESLWLSVKKVLREQAASAGLATFIGICGLLYDPAVIVPLIQKYAPAINAVVAAQIVSMLARVAVDQFRHNVPKK